MWITISRGHEWQHRRELNDKVLGYGQPLHRYAGEFLAIIRDEVAGSGGPAPRLRE